MGHSKGLCGLPFIMVVHDYRLYGTPMGAPNLTCHTWLIGCKGLICIDD